MTESPPTVIARSKATWPSSRGAERRGDPDYSHVLRGPLDCRAALAMTESPTTVIARSKATWPSSRGATIARGEVPWPSREPPPPSSRGAVIARSEATWQSDAAIQPTAVPCEPPGLPRCARNDGIATNRHRENLPLLAVTRYHRHREDRPQVIATRSAPSIKGCRYTDPANPDSATR